MSQRLSKNERVWVEEANRRYRQYKNGRITSRLARDVIRDARLAISTRMILIAFSVFLLPSLVAGQDVPSVSDADIVLENGGHLPDPRLSAVVKKTVTIPPADMSTKAELMVWYFELPDGALLVMRTGNNYTVVSQIVLCVDPKKADDYTGWQYLERLVLTKNGQIKEKVPAKPRPQPDSLKQILNQ